MSTILGFRCRDGVVLAGDHVLVRKGRVESRNRQHVFGLGDDIGVAAVGSDVDRFVDRLEGELRSYRLERGAISVAVLERFASEIARETTSEAIVTAREADDTDGTQAALRGVYADGSTLTDSSVVFGSGASLALGQLEAADTDVMSVSEAETYVRELFATVAERDPGTGDEIDVWTLSDTGEAPTGGSDAVTDSEEDAADP